MFAVESIRREGPNDATVATGPQTPAGPARAGRDRGRRARWRLHKAAVPAVHLARVTAFSVVEDEQGVTVRGPDPL